jgi:hypothetical protein
MIHVEGLFRWLRFFLMLFFILFYCVLQNLIIFTTKLFFSIFLYIDLSYSFGSTRGFWQPNLVLLMLCFLIFFHLIFFNFILLYFYSRELIIIIIFSSFSKVSSLGFFGSLKSNNNTWILFFYTTEKISPTYNKAPAHSEACAFCLVCY